MTKNELAIQEFRKGFNCAQAVISAFSEGLKIDKITALRLSTGFGAGMGRLQGTCGAVTGAFMMIGAYTSTKYDNNADRKANAYKLIQTYNDKFIILHNSSDCKDLIGCDLRTPEGQAAFHDNNISEKICEKCISNSVDILNELIEN